MNTFRDVIDCWPSLQAFADDQRVKYVTAQLMRHRDSIAAKHWRRVVATAEKRKIPGVTLELLAGLKPGRAKRQRPKTGVQRPEIAA